MPLCAEAGEPLVLGDEPLSGTSGGPGASWEVPRVCAYTLKVRQSRTQRMVFSVTPCTRASIEAEYPRANAARMLCTSNSVRMRRAMSTPEARTEYCRR